MVTPTRVASSFWVISSWSKRSLPWWCEGCGTVRDSWPAPPGDRGIFPSRISRRTVGRGVRFSATHNLRDTMVVFRGPDPDGRRQPRSTSRSLCTTTPRKADRTEGRTGTMTRTPFPRGQRRVQMQDRRAASARRGATSPPGTGLSVCACLAGTVPPRCESPVLDPVPKIGRSVYRIPGSSYFPHPEERGNSGILARVGLPASTDSRVADIEIWTDLNTRLATLVSTPARRACRAVRSGPVGRALRHPGRRILQATPARGPARAVVPRARQGR